MAVGLVICEIVRDSVCRHSVCAPRALRRVRGGAGPRAGLTLFRVLCFQKPASVISTRYTFIRDYARASMELPNLISRTDACVEVHSAADEDERER